MADNIQNISITRNTWVDLYAATGLAVGAAIVVSNIGNDDVYLAVQATQPDSDHDAYDVVKRPPSPNTMQNTEGDAGAWAYCNNSDGKLAISTQIKNGFLPVTEARLTDSFGIPLGTEDNPIEIGETLSPFTFLEYAHRHTGVLSTIAVETVASDYEIEVLDGSVFAALDVVQVSNGVTEATFPTLTNVVGNILTLDRYLDQIHQVGTAVEIVDSDMSSIGGTIAAPLEYIISPNDIRVVHIQRITLSMIQDALGDLDLFGGIAPLENGVQMRVRNDGVYRTITNWKTNQEIKDDGYDLEFNTRSGGQGAYGTSARITFERFGTEIRLDPATGDQLEFYIKDASITGLGRFNIKGQGHYK